MPDNRYHPSAEQAALVPEVSGNTINGLGERSPRRPNPIYWQRPETIAHGAMQRWMVTRFNAVPDFAEVYARPGARGPRELDPVAPACEEREPAAWSDAVKAFALAHEADLCGIAALDEAWLYEGCDPAREGPWVIVLGIAMDYAQFAAAPSSDEDTRSALEVSERYNQGARATAALANWIRGHGYRAKPHAGPWAGSLTLTPAAIAAGLGELGRHGNLIHDALGSCFRLAAVVTDLPLVADAPRTFGADDFCTRCQVCTRACPPGAISGKKQWVRGVEKWYVDFDACLPYFNETHGCGICMGVCPWSRPGAAPKLAAKWARRRAR